VIQHIDDNDCAQSSTTGIVRIGRIGVNNSLQSALQQSPSVASQYSRELGKWEFSVDIQSAQYHSHSRTDFL